MEDHGNSGKDVPELLRSSSVVEHAAPPLSRDLDQNLASSPLGKGMTADGSHKLASVMDSVLVSDIALTVLLNRLKQSIASAREFAAFLKKRSTLEEEQAQGIKKLCKTSYDSLKRPENKQESYSRHYGEFVQIHDRMADNSVQFALSLHQMHEDLHELATNMERGRKTWKQNGLSAERKVQDAEGLMEKAKGKYNSSAEDYDKARTGDKATGRVFGLKGPKSAAQHEEELQRKVQQADADYSAKVQAAQHQRQELVEILRPQAVRALKEQIRECDNALTLQLQKYALLTERLLLGNGLCVNPVQSQSSSDSPIQLREIIAKVDNEDDFTRHVISFASKATNAADIRYERHPTLCSPPTIAKAAQSLESSPNPPSKTPINQGTMINGVMGTTGLKDSPIISSGQLISGSTNMASALPQTKNAVPLLQPGGILGSPQLNGSAVSLASPRKPVFGISLEDLLKRDGLAIPIVVYQCIQAIELFGLDVEGIYRLSSSAIHVTKLKAMFDTDSSAVDFRNPEAFYHDVNSVSGILKQFFRELPEPLLTCEHYQAFIDAARIDDDVARRDNIHATINALPDANYATLRGLILHLQRVQERSSTNRMNAGNLAIIFGPTLMGSGPNIADAGWQVKVVDTILQNTYQIFDED